ncbi:MAG: GIY-YIG nuclease family protein, partial [Bacteroidetes bacterium]|nr:GIY-YIG nuclease family protein [Bacteroidota bacterium]
MYAIIDIETTGGSSTANKIIEIAIYVYDGNKITDSFHSLINPEKNIPENIFRLTGINNEMVADAPRFYEIAKEIVEFTEGKIFIAHNVSFDYGFIRSEFKSLGFDYRRKRLCTVRLSRRIFPNLRSYSLGNLCNSLGINIKNRHRADGDAEATVKLFQLLQKNDDGEHIEEMLNGRSREATLPPHLPKERFELIPEDTGIYYFHDEHNKVIYVGKAKNIRSRILSHFTQVSSKSQKMKNNIHDISWEITGNEFVAFLLESSEIKRYWPLFNAAQKRVNDNYGVAVFTNKAGYLQLMFDRINKLKSEPVITFRRINDGVNYLTKVIEEFKLCGKLGGVQTGPYSCWNYQIKKCSGACVGEEAPEVYNRKVA